MPIPIEPIPDPDQVKRYLEHKWGPVNCRQCQQGEWLVSDKFFQLVEYQGAYRPPPRPIVPVIPITCSNCGNTMLINALVAGFMQSEGRGHDHG